MRAVPANNVQRFCDWPEQPDSSLPAPVLSVRLCVPSCPLCKKELRHPALAAQLAPIDALESVIQERAMQRLKYEGRDRDAAIVNANGAFFNDPVGFAIKQYLFYMCFKCAQPYFAGGYQVRSNTNKAYSALASGRLPLPLSLRPRLRLSLPPPRLAVHADCSPCRCSVLVLLLPFPPPDCSAKRRTRRSTRRS